MFILLPLVTGVTIAMVTPRAVAGAALLAGSISVVICLFGLIAGKAEGILCAVLAFPMIFGSVLAGIVAGLLLRMLIKGRQGFTTNCVILLAAPALIFAGDHYEMKAFLHPRSESITTTVFLAATPNEVWANIQSLDRVAGRKPLLMHLGLPIPQRCVLQGTAVGSKRTCYFDQGFIEESVLEWDPPRRMRLSVDRTHLPGRHWLEFEGAEYDLAAVGSGTLLTRVTIIRSNLEPAWYWARFEKWGVASEHEYLFSDLANRFPAPRLR